MIIYSKKKLTDNFKELRLVVLNNKEKIFHTDYSFMCAERLLFSVCVKSCGN